MRWESEYNDGRRGSGPIFSLTAVSAVRDEQERKKKKKKKNMVVVMEGDGTGAKFAVNQEVRDSSKFLLMMHDDDDDSDEQVRRSSVTLMNWPQMRGEARGYSFSFLFVYLYYILHCPSIGVGEAGRKRLSLMGDPGAQISITPDWHLLQALGLVFIESQKKKSV